MTEPPRIDCARKCSVSQIAPGFFDGCIATDAAKEPNPRGPRVVFECPIAGCGKTLYIRRIKAEDAQ